MSLTFCYCKISSCLVIISFGAAVILYLRLLGIGKVDRNRNVGMETVFDGAQFRRPL